ncbi:MAG: mycofactocin system FadH/OYE family oxidoreductase 1 [Actinobacteria bacterium]|nr:mycofactocin system FadH/OYE family oxidoreductase 1 [Actinomycetota bacterium]
MSLLEPLQLGGRVARNRVVFGSHETNLGHRRALSPQALAYYRRRAAGGAGIIVLEAASVHVSDWPYERAPLAESCRDDWAVIGEAIHAEGALVLAGLNHAGGQGASAFSQAPLLAPSRVPEVNTREVPKAMEDGDIEAVVSGFASATRLALDAGLDGVEVNAGQHSLIRQFLSGLTNQRRDPWGEDRLAFARRVLETVRGEVDSFGSSDQRPIVGLRLSCDELAPWAGIVPDAGAEIAAALAPLVDCITVVRGAIYSVGATRPDGHVAPGFNLELTRQVRAAVPATVAVIAQGSIIDVAMAEEIIASGAADLVEMTRAQIADPDLVAKTAAGDAGRIRPCILCNQACSVRDNRNPIVSCVGEPSAGHELDDQPVTGRATSPTSVLVVGGGVAGMEAARVAALRGHQVRLVERRSWLGGAIRLGASAPGRERLATLADWLEAECRALGVRIELDHDVDATRLETAEHGAGPVVILATGARDGLLPFGIETGATVLQARTLLDAHLQGGIDAALALVGNGSILVWDPIGGPIAVSIAELLAGARPVELVTHDQVVGNLLARSGDMGTANVRLHGAGVTLHKRSLLREVGPGWADVEAVYTGERRRLEVSAVVACGHELGEDALWRTTGERHLQAGDAVAPRTLYEAVLEGRRAALAIERSGPA